ncbi:MAG: DUF1343 domain-containing protein [Deltaproteobacteria bacterium]|nr:DUF1343 domain-containing protein [Deltaproteobacteria bacterium]
MGARVRTGLEVLCSEGTARLRGRSVGLLAHPASVTSELWHAREMVAGAGARVRALFGPEHGVGGEAQDMEGVADDDGPVRTYSLYGSEYSSLSPRPGWLDGLDAVVIDLQDVGSRYYTFVWTALLMARACAARGIEVLVCDRPNPLGGAVIEGSPQRPELRSFVGLEACPVRHGLTLGEVLSWRAAEESLPNVTVIPMEGWTRAMRWEDTGLPWVLPSPNMPTPDTATVYPGGCLIEGTNLSEGRGTTRPFEIFGAPWVDGAALASAMEADGGGGMRARAMSFRPMFQKHSGVTCQGVQVHVTDPRVFAPYRAYLSALRACRRFEGFRWRTEKYEFVDDVPAIDLLTGDGAVREGLDAGATVDELMAIGRERMSAWREGERSRWLYREG